MGMAGGVAGWWVGWERARRVWGVGGSGMHKPLYSYLQRFPTRRSSGVVGEQGVDVSALRALASHVGTWPAQLPLLAGVCQCGLLVSLGVVG